LKSINGIECIDEEIRRKIKTIKDTAMKIFYYKSMAYNSKQYSGK